MLQKRIWISITSYVMAFLITCNLGFANELSDGLELENLDQTNEQLEEAGADEPNLIDKLKTDIESIISGSAASFYLEEDMDITSTIEVSGAITLHSNGSIMLEKEPGFEGCVFKINPNASLTLVCDVGELIIDGNDGASGSSLVENHGVFRIGNGVILRNNEGINGGAIHNFGALEMSGGEISGCSALNGGAIYNTGTFNLSKGDIQSNKASDTGGAVFNSSLGTFNMSGGTIYGNNAQTGSGVYNVGSFNLSGSAYLPYGDGNDVVLNNSVIHVTGALIAGYTPIATVSLLNPEVGSTVAEYSSSVSIDPASFACKDDIFRPSVSGRKLILCSSSNRVCSSTPAFFGQSIVLKLHFDYIPKTVTGTLYSETGAIISKSGESLVKTSTTEDSSSNTTTKDVIDLISHSDNCGSSGAMYQYKVTASSTPTGRCKLVLVESQNSEVVGEVFFEFDKSAPKISDAKVTNATASSSNSYKFVQNAKVKFYYLDEESEIKSIILTRPVKGAELESSDLSSDSGGDYVEYTVTEAGNYTFQLVDLAGNKNELKYTFTKDTQATSQTTTNTKTTGGSTTSSAVVGTGPISVRLITAKEPAGKTVAKMTDDKTLALADYLDSNFFASTTNKLEVNSTNGAALTITAADIISKAKSTSSTASPATTQTQTSTASGSAQATSASATASSSAATMAVSYIKKYSGVNLSTCIEEDDNKLASLRQKNKTQLANGEDISLLSFAKRHTLPCKATVAVVADSVASARSLNLPVEIYKVNSSGAIESLVSSPTANNGKVQFTVENTNSDFLFKQAPFSAKQKDNTFTKCKIEGLEATSNELLEAVSQPGVKSLAINGDGFIWTMSKTQAKKTSRKNAWDFTLKVKTPEEIRSQFGLDPTKCVIVDFATKGKNGSNANIYVKVDDSLKNKKGIRVYKVTANGKLSTLEKSKTVSKNGIVKITTTST